MWSLLASAGHSTSALGVGHFTVPPDVSRDDRDRSHGITALPPAVRNIVVPHDIVAVPRRSPIKVRKRTPWHPAQTPIVVERGGSREWFSDRLFVESRQRNLPAACSTSAMVHVVVVIVVLLLVAATAARADLTPRKIADVTLRMPSFVALLPVDVAVPAAPARTAPAAAIPPRPAAPLASTIAAQAPAPLDAPSRIEPEPATFDVEPVDGAVAGGQPGGTTDGVVGGTGSGPAVDLAPSAAPMGPFRVGDGIERPRKIKDVKPVYPQPAISARVGGNVLIEATIGADGKVHDAVVVKSIAILDAAALAAVRQWEFEPSRLNGVAVAVTMVIVVTFALL